MNGLEEGDQLSSTLRKCRRLITSTSQHILVIAFYSIIMPLRFFKIEICRVFIDDLWEITCATRVRMNIVLFYHVLPSPLLFFPFLFFLNSLLSSHLKPYPPLFTFLFFLFFPSLFFLFFSLLIFFTSLSFFFLFFFPSPLFPFFTQTTSSALVLT